MLHSEVLDASARASDHSGLFLFPPSQAQVMWTMSAALDRRLLAGVGQWGHDKRLERERWDTLLAEQWLVF